MSLLRHVRACNHYPAERFVPLRHGEHRLGLIRKDNAELLRRFPAVYAVTAEEVSVIAPGDFADLSARVDETVEALVGDGLIPKWRNEFFAVAPHWSDAPHFKLDRGAVPFFGVRAYGVHLNGFRRDAGPLKLWIGRRAADKAVAPDKLDNIVAGGIDHAHGVVETLAKEAEEEAGMAAALIARAVPVGAISYRLETKLGLRNDVLFTYDIELPADFTPHNNDGEFSGFRLEDAAAMLELVRQGDAFKFNVNLVMIDFAIRHGLVTPEDPDYLALVTGLRRPLD